jgi:hypothetical protein
MVSVAALLVSMTMFEPSVPLKKILQPRLVSTAWPVALTDFSCAFSIQQRK